MNQTLSIIIPVYNEEKFIEEIYSRVIGVTLHPGISKEVIIIDDNSNDGTNEIISRIANNKTIILKQNKNRGKGACIRLGKKKHIKEIIFFQPCQSQY